MIYLLPINGRLRKDGIEWIPPGIGWYHPEAPQATVINIQRPFSHISRGPVIANENSLKEYRKWLFRKLLISKTVIEEFTHMLDVLIQEGDLILQCSCIPPKPCHGQIIRDALIWAKKFGIDDWHPQLKKFAASNYAKHG
jgi:hypothetical protein